MKGKPLKIALFTLVAVLLASATYFFVINRDNERKISQVSTVNHKFGLTGNCRKVPSFIRSLKMQAPSLDSRQQDGSMGLQIRDYAKKDQTWQHSSWAKSGYIGSFDRDTKGNIYVSPLPYVSLLKNPPEKQNHIYIIDAKTADMSLFMKLPFANAPNSRNPFGVMGLYFDCDTQSLYASSLAGSKPLKEHGVIYQIDLNSKKIVSKLEHTDSIGLGVFNTKKGKRLYFGSARNSHLFSIALDDKGHFIGEKRYELSLSQIKGGDSTVVKKVSFSNKNNQLSMTLKETEFGFRLLAENNPFKKKYNFDWNKKSGKWDFKRLSKE